MTSLLCNGALDKTMTGKDGAIFPAYSTVDLVKEEPEEADPWDLPELKDTGVKWSGEKLPILTGRVVVFMKTWLIIKC